MRILIALAVLSLALHAQIVVIQGTDTISGSRTTINNNFAYLDANKQASDVDLSCLAALVSSGVFARTGAGTCAARTITGTANQITVTNGDGVSGNPTISIPSSPTLPGTTTGTFSGNLTGNVTGNASTATALSANPANCSAGQAAAGITAAGVAEGCFTPAGGGSLPSMTGNANEVLTNDGTTARWEPMVGGASGCLDFTSPFAPDFDFDCLLTQAFAWTGYHDYSGGQLRLPEVAFASLPAAGANTGKIFVVTDASAAGSCSAGGGSAKALCRSNGTIYESLGGGSSSSALTANAYLSTVPMWSPGTSVSSSAPSTQVRGFLFRAPDKITLTKAVANIGTLSASNHFLVGVYSPGCATKYFQAEIATDATGAASDTFGSTTLEAGWYWLLWAATNATAAVSAVGTNTTFYNMFNAVLPDAFTFTLSGTISGTTLPASGACGTATGAGMQVPLVVFAP